MTQASPGIDGRRRRLITHIAGATLLATGTTAFSRTRAAPPGLPDIPAIGMGTWLTFDVSPVGNALDQRVDVLRTFFRLGGGMVDSSPMYGEAENMIGRCMARLGRQDTLFAASKIWTPVDLLGQRQMANSEDLWGVTPIDLMYVHNLLAWQAHLPELRQWKAAGRIRHLGITTSHGRRHDELARVMQSETLDAVQLTYNPVDRDAERRLLPLALERGMSVVVNRPFQGGSLIDRLKRHPLPGIAAALGCRNWAQLVLLYIVSHPAVTCAIPATRRVDHMQENMGTLLLDTPDAATRRDMLQAMLRV